jgi:Na+-driven multidrug efflux pump
MNLSQAITTFTGQNIGAGKIERVKRGHLSALGLSSAISLAIGLVVILAGAPLIGIFTTDAEVIRIGSEYFRIVGFFYFASAS